MQGGKQTEGNATRTEVSAGRTLYLDRFLEKTFQCDPHYGQCGPHSILREISKFALNQEKSPRGMRPALTISAGRTYNLIKISENPKIEENNWKGIMRPALTPVRAALRRRWKLNKETNPQCGPH